MPPAYSLRIVNMPDFAEFAVTLVWDWDGQVFSNVELIVGEDNVGSDRWTAEAFDNGGGPEGEHSVICVNVDEESVFFVQPWHEQTWSVVSPATPASSASNDFDLADLATGNDIKVEMWIADFPDSDSDDSDDSDSDSDDE